MFSDYLFSVHSLKNSCYPNNIEENLTNMHVTHDLHIMTSFTLAAQTSNPFQTCYDHFLSQISFHFPFTSRAVTKAQIQLITDSL